MKLAKDAERAAFEDGKELGTEEATHELLKSFFNKNGANKKAYVAMEQNFREKTPQIRKLFGPKNKYK